MIGSNLAHVLTNRLLLCVQSSGEVTYNGFGLDEFVPQKTAAYISQNDIHDGEMTVKEVLDFSAKCQGVGQRYGEPPLHCLLTVNGRSVPLLLRLFSDVVACRAAPGAGQEGAAAGDIS